MLVQYEDLLQRASDVLGDKVTAGGLVGELKLRGETGIGLARKVARQSRGRHAVAHPMPWLQDAVLKVLASPPVVEEKAPVCLRFDLFDVGRDAAAQTDGATASGEVSQERCNDSADGKWLTKVGPKDFTTPWRDKYQFSAEVGTDDPAQSAGVLAVLLRLGSTPGGAQAVAEVTAWVAARRATRPSAPTQSASAHAAAVALAESPPPAQAAVSAVKKLMRKEPGGDEAVVEFIAWVG